MFHLTNTSSRFRRNTLNQDHLHYHPVIGYCFQKFSPLAVLLLQFQSPLCLSPKRLKLVMGTCLNFFDMMQQFVSYLISCMHGGEVRRGICAAPSGTSGEEQEEGYEDPVQEEGQDVDAFPGRCCSMFFCWQVVWSKMSADKVLPPCGLASVDKKFVVVKPIITKLPKTAPLNLRVVRHSISNRLFFILFPV